MPHNMSLFVRSPSDDPRNRRRLDLTKKAYMLEGLNTDFLDAGGRSPLANMWTMILFGDYVAYSSRHGIRGGPNSCGGAGDFKETMSAEA